MTGCHVLSKIKCMCKDFINNPSYLWIHANNGSMYPSTCHTIEDFMVVLQKTPETLTTEKSATMRSNNSQYAVHTANQLKVIQIIRISDLTLVLGQYIGSVKPFNRMILSQIHCE
jgi:hypothetical protein